MDLLSDWTKDLILWNKICVEEKLFMEPGLVLTTPVVELIFLICSYFKQQNEVRCLSVELFDRFVRLQFKDLFEKVWDGNETSFHRKWSSVEKEVCTKTSLAMLSCIQIASKVVFQPTRISAKAIQRYLEAENKLMTLASIKRSEMRVWKTLNFRAFIPTVYTYVSLLLEQLKINFDLNLDNIGGRVNLFTDVDYLHHQEIFRKLSYLCTGRMDLTLNEKETFTKAGCNLMYRAAAVVVLSITFASSGSCEEIYEEVSSLTNISSDDIKVLANIIHHFIVLS